MTTVVITGWIPGFEKIACTNLVRSRLALDLRDGKVITDTILRGTMQRLELPTDAEAASLVLELIKVGALAHVEPAA